jgi:folate-binding Fe-S cluster repair protein YgfZ
MTPFERFQAARTALAVGPLRPRTLLHAGGPDARDFLHRMLTQDLKGLPPGGGAHFALLTVKGHLVGEGHVLLLPDGVLLDLDPAAAGEVRAQLEKMIIMDDVTVTDRSEG